MKWSLLYSKFLVRHSAVQRGGSSDEVDFDCFSPEFWIPALSLPTLSVVERVEGLTPGSLLHAPCPMLYAFSNLQSFSQSRFARANW
jgi:hypothetical protein